jgi:hypothetical protein
MSTRVKIKKSIVVSNAEAFNLAGTPLFQEIGKFRPDVEFMEIGCDKNHVHLYIYGNSSSSNASSNARSDFSVNFCNLYIEASVAYRSGAYKTEFPYGSIRPSIPGIAV